jgi:hypothetical protein
MFFISFSHHQCTILYYYDGWMSQKVYPLKNIISWQCRLVHGYDKSYYFLLCVISCYIISYHQRLIDLLSKTQFVKMHNTYPQEFFKICGGCGSSGSELFWIYTIIESHIIIQTLKWSGMWMKCTKINGKVCTFLDIHITGGEVKDFRYLSSTVIQG